MKINITLSLFALLACFFLLESYTSGLAGGGNPPRMQDRTGSPFTENSGTCQTCHASGSFDPTLEIELLDGDVAVTSYIPEETYTLRFTIDAANGTPVRRGFQGVVLSADTDQNAGTFSTAPNGMRVETVEGRDYVEHSMPNTTTNFFEIEWTAPAPGSGPINVYSTAVVANGNGTTGGDNGDNAVLTLDENISSTSAISGAVNRIAIAPNPAVDVVQLSLETSRGGIYQMQILSLNGQAVLQEQVAIQEGANQLPVDISFLPKGTYFLQVRNSETIATTKLVKL